MKNSRSDEAILSDVTVQEMGALECEEREQANAPIELKWPPPRKAAKKGAKTRRSDTDMLKSISARDYGRLQTTTTFVLGKKS